VTELIPLTKEQGRYAERGLIVVRMLARTFAYQWPKVPESDFVSVGHEAVVKAAARFDPKRGVVFERFAELSVWGAMLDLAHHETFMVRGTLKGIARALSQHVEMEQSPDAWLDEPAGPAKDEVLSNLRGRAAELVAAAFAGGTKGLTAEDIVIEEEEQRRTLGALRQGLDDLNEDERTFIRMYYEEGVLLEDIAKRRGVVVRTVYRMHDRIKAKLAKALR